MSEKDLNEEETKETVSEEEKTAIETAKDDLSKVLDPVIFLLFLRIALSEDIPKVVLSACQADDIRNFGFPFQLFRSRTLELIGRRTVRESITFLFQVFNCDSGLIAQRNAGWSREFDHIIICQRIEIDLRRRENRFQRRPVMFLLFKNIGDGVVDRVGILFRALILPHLLKVFQRKAVLGTFVDCHLENLFRVSDGLLDNRIFISIRFESECVFSAFTFRNVLVLEEGVSYTYQDGALCIPFCSNVARINRHVWVATVGVRNIT